jgi:hypothetical protein
VGTDIRGFIEVGHRHRAGGVRWTAAEKLSVVEHYDMFGCLFGVMNYANFRPIAPNRGIPEDASAEVKNWVAEILTWAKPDSADFHSATWISWAEIKAIDWREEGLEADSRLHRYRYTEEGTLVFEGKSAWSRDWGEQVGVSIEDALGKKLIWEKDVELVAGERVYLAEKLQRKDVLTPDWMDVFKNMESLAAKHGDELVRLVVWFDS